MSAEDKAIAALMAVLWVIVWVYLAMGGRS